MLAADGSEPIRHTIAGVEKDYDVSDEKVFVELECSRLLEHYAHYLRYDSAYRLAFSRPLVLMATLGESHDCRRDLTGRGRPTVAEESGPYGRVATIRRSD